MSKGGIESQKAEFLRQASVGSGLRLALLAQFEFANRLTKALVESGALTAEAAEQVLLGTAKARDKVAAPALAEPRKSPYFMTVLPYLAAHASRLRGIAKKLGAKPEKAAS